MSFASLGLQPDWVARLTALHYTEPTPIQSAAIPAILSGRDVLAGAQTGTGKTAAFTLPLLQQLPDSVDAKAPLVLILTPTRELAQQVTDSVQRYAQGTDIQCVSVYGGVSIRQQVEALAQPVHVVVATPGRLLDLLQQGALQLHAVRTWVLDEADRLLDLGFKDELYRLRRQLPDTRQTLFFSATFPQAVKDVAFSLLHDPLQMDVTPANTTAAQIQQILYSMDKRQKRPALAYLIGSGQWSQVLVFVRTKQGADALVAELKLDGLRAEALHGDKSQGARQRALTEFKAGQVRVLVATDVAARGIDVVDLPYVVNYELPFQAEDYVHRIGRTGRAGKEGKAISLVSRDEEGLLADIEALIDQPLPMIWLEGFEPSFDEPENHGRQLRKQRQKNKAKAKAQASYGIRKKK